MPSNACSASINHWRINHLIVYRSKKSSLDGVRKDTPYKSYILMLLLCSPSPYDNVRLSNDCKPRLQLQAQTAIQSYFYHTNPIH